MQENLDTYHFDLSIPAKKYFKMYSFRFIKI
jgi:hypothetical protein